MRMDRRVALCALSSAFLCLPRLGSAQPASPGEVERWIDLAIEDARGKEVSGTLLLSRFVEPIYVLRKPTSWLPDDNQKGLPAVHVPVGFVTDFASIPSLFWSLLRPDGNYAHAAIIHDYLYWTQGTSRDTADQIFRLAMEDFSVPSVAAATIYGAVRLFGGSAWESNSALITKGEKRILKRFPEDPRATWEEWKKDPANFE